MSREDAYKEALESVIRVLDKTEGAEDETWLYHVFRDKKIHAAQAIQFYINRKIAMRYEPRSMGAATERDTSPK